MKDMREWIDALRGIGELQEVTAEALAGALEEAGA